MRRILVDIDGVLCDWIGSYLKVYQDLGGTVPEDFRWKTFNAHHALPDYSRLNDSVWRRPELFLFPKPLPGAISALYKLNKDYSVYLATACPPRSVEYRDKWLAEYFPFIQRSRQVFYVGLKSIIQADYHVEDQPQRLAPWLAHNPTGRGVLIQSDWNGAKEYTKMLNDAVDGKRERWSRQWSLQRWAEWIT